MYRWRIRLLEGPGPSWHGDERLWLEVPPRGAAFTLSCLMHLGHPIHLALIDAYLRGAVPFPRGASLGWDSRAILANLVGPLVLLRASGRERATLADLLLLPPSGEAAACSRLLVWGPDGPPTWLECTAARPRRPASKDAAPASSPWRRVISAMRVWDGRRACAQEDADPWSIVVMSAERSESNRDALAADRALVAALRTLAWARVGRLLGPFEHGIEALRRATEGIWAASGDEERGLLAALLADSLAEAVALGGDPDPALAEPIPASARATGSAGAQPSGWAIWSRHGDVPVEARDPWEAARLLTRDLGRHSRASVRTVWEGSPVVAALAAEVDGGYTVAVLPDSQDDLESTLARTEGATWATLEALIGTQIDERRSEPIALRLVGPDRTTELSIGRSLVLPRNRRVFAAWLGSDGRVLIRLTGNDGALSPAPV